MPPVEGAGYLIGYLLEVGPTMAGGMGPARLTNQELLAWQTNTGIRLASWECRFIVRLSGEYIAELHRSEKADATPPWRGEVSDQDLRDTANSLRLVIGRMAT